MPSAQYPNLILGTERRKIKVENRVCIFFYLSSVYNIYHRKQLQCPMDKFIICQGHHQPSVSKKRKSYLQSKDSSNLHPTHNVCRIYSIKTKNNFNFELCAGE